jgi:hypothetical protein
LAAFQVAPILVVGIGDRYYLPIMLAVAPLLALMASAGSPRAPGRSMVWAVAGLVGLLGIYGMGELDFLAWHNARYRLAQAVFPRFAPAEPNLSEDSSRRHDIPVFERTGRLAPVNNDPELMLAFAGPDDPRPGVVYGPWPRGKVVAVCLRNVDDCRARLAEVGLR